MEMTSKARSRSRTLHSVQRVRPGHRHGLNERYRWWRQRCRLNCRALDHTRIKGRRGRVALMRSPVVLVVLIVSAPAVVGLGSSGSRISHLPDGRLSGHIYTNDALGLRYEVPSGWVATADPKGPVSLDYRRPDGPANQCSKVLLSLHAPQQSEGRFNATVSLFVIDPSCFSGAKFPRSLEDKDKILKFSDKIVKAFSNTLYITQRRRYRRSSRSRTAYHKPHGRRRVQCRRES